MKIRSKIMLCIILNYKFFLIYIVYNQILALLIFKIKIINFTKKTARDIMSIAK